MFAEERRNLIRSILTRDGRVEVADLAIRFEVSEDTVRRDLRDLAEAGFLQKTHGGAVALDVANLQWPARSELQQAAKAKIGGAAAGLVKPRETVILDAGLTVLAMARQLRARPLKIITNSLEIANHFDRESDVSLVLTGGEWNSGTRYLSGAETLQALALYRADWVFLGACALHPQAGMTAQHAEDASTKRAMLSSAARAVLLVDHSKFDQVAPHFVGPLSALHAVVTDAQPDWLAQAGPRLVIA